MGSTGQARHCWVVNLAGYPGRWPGLLLQWSYTGQRWVGRVTVAAEDDNGPVMITLWVAAEHLQPL